jgi:hypothetical protein
LPSVSLSVTRRLRLLFPPLGGIEFSPFHQGREKYNKNPCNHVNPWPRPLAQTWHAKIESHSSCLLNIKAVIAFYDHFAPGQAGIENIVFIIEFS